MATPAAARRPRLSLQIKTSPGPAVRSVRGSRVSSDPKSPTAFNTLSNVYVTAIERSTPVQSTPLTAINLTQALRLQTDNTEEAQDVHQRIQTPYTETYPDTPVTANPVSPKQVEMVFPSTMTATPPRSAGPVEPSEPRAFSFAARDTWGQLIPTSPASSRRRAPAAFHGKAPYTHPRGIHSILRNSPLPPSSALTPVSPRRQSLRLQEKAARRVGYESPLTQTITTEKYTRSHIDLLTEEASPFSTSPATEDSDMVLDLAMAYTNDETRDGGQTPGPFEEMRRRMAGLGTQAAAASPGPTGIKKRKRKEKKRRWVWTIGQEDDEESGAMTALRAATQASGPPVSPPAKAAIQISVEPAGTPPDDAREQDVDMADATSVSSADMLRWATTPRSGPEADAKTPTADGGAATATAKAGLLGSADWTNPGTSMRRDSPVPPTW